MRIRALSRAAVVGAAAALVVGGGAGSAVADRTRDAQWPLVKYDAAKEVWPVSTGAGVTVGLIDTGVSVTHQDLTGQILPGADFSGGSSGGRTDEDGHGTAMASLIAGHGHGVRGDSGVMGLAPGVRILPVKVSLAGDDLSPPAGDVRVPEAIRFAVDHGAKVINMSLVDFSRQSSAERSAVRYAVDHDVVLVAGTGNGGLDRVGYPAAFPGVVAVGAVDMDGKVWAKSSRGPEVTLTAPGVHVVHADNDGPAKYNGGSGTSDATAYVSAIAALVRAKYPELSAGQVINRLIKSAVAPPDGSAAPNDRYGYGIASPRRALTMDIPAGPKANPLLGRAEAQGAPAPARSGAAVSGGGDSAAPAAASDDGGVPVWVVATGAGAVVVLLVVVVVAVRRRRRGGPGGPGGPGGGYPPVQPPYPGQGYPHPQQPNPYQQPGYGPGYPPQQQPNPYQQQNPYQQ